MRWWLPVSLLILLLPACSGRDEPVVYTPKASAVGQAVISSPDPLATELGLSVLRRHLKAEAEAQWLRQPS